MRILCLASASPRRLELLRQLGLSPRVTPARVDETRRGDEPGPDDVLRLARDKATAVWQACDAPADLVVLGADTAVCIDGEVLGKPADRADGLRMLGLLAGRQHQVYTGVAVVCADVTRDALCRTEVEFGPLSAVHMSEYWASGEPRDKAGAYAIQGRAAMFVRSISGSYSNVVGLPLYETAQLLAACGLDPRLGNGTATP